MKFSRVVVVLVAAAIFVSGAWAKVGESAKVTGEMIKAASKWIDSLGTEQKETALMSFDDEERFNWAYVPKPRKGLTLKSMSAKQQKLAKAFLQASLSERGMWKAETTRKLEGVLQTIEGPDRKFARDPENYYFSIFGNPSKKGVWGWRFEGHHISLNFTIADGKMLVAAPRFFGSNPGTVMEGELKGLRLLGNEEDFGRSLVLALSETQRKKAIFEEKAFRDIVTKTQRKVDPMKPEGIQASRLSGDQRSLLVKLINEYVSAMPEELAEERMSTLKNAGWDNIYFGWAGSIKPGEGHYYRVQGPTFLIEYDNVQNKAKHVHCVWRDFDGDFGRDLLKEHYHAHGESHDH